MSELSMKTGPRQRLVMRATLHGAVVATQVVMHDSRSHGWSTMTQHHLDRDEVSTLRDYLNMILAEDEMREGRP